MNRRYPHRPQRSSKNYIRYLVIAVLAMVILDYVFWNEGRPYVDNIVENSDSALPEISEIINEDEAEIIEIPDPQEVLPETVELTSEEGIEPAAKIPEIPEVEADTENENPLPPGLDKEAEIFGAPEERPVFEVDPIKNPDAIRPIPEVMDQPVIEPQSDAAPQISGPGKIAIVIDDMGMNLKQSRAAIALPSEITLAFLPYAEQLKPLSAQAREEGHELIIHAPMEAMNSEVPLGPISLTREMNHQSFQESFAQMADSFEGYVGVNNHMGSRLTQEPKYMAYLMEEIRKRDLYFLDSKTIHTSIASQTARAYGIPTIERDVFLDHEDTPEFVQSALKKVERMAARNGSVVAIGHPKEHTMSALKKWIPTLKNKGFELVSLSEIIDDYSPKKPDQLVYHINE